MPYVDTSIRTFDISLADLKTQITNPSSDIYYAKWNNFDNKDIGEAILKILSGFSHTVDNYRSYLLENLYLPTDERDAKEQIYEMLNYKEGLKRSMLLTVNFMWNGCGPVGSVEIPKFYKMSLVADGTEYPFLTLKKNTYLPDANRLYVDVVLGEPLENTLVVSEITSNKILISVNDVDYESVSFTVDDKEWTKVKNIYYETNTELKYSIHRESDGTYIYLPEDWRDFVPSEVSDVVILAAELQDGFDINTNDPIQFCLLDPLVCSLGQEVTDQFRVYLMKTNNSAESGSTGKRRIITLEDYELEAKSFSGILDARAYNWGEGSPLGIRTPNVVRLAVVGDTGEVSSFVKDGLKDYIESISLSEIDFDFVETLSRKVDLNLYVNIGELKGTVFEGEIYQTIRTTILNFMSYDNLGIGRGFNPNELISAIARSDFRIKYVELYGYEPQEPLLNEIISLGRLSIDFAVESGFKYDVFTSSESESWGPLGVDLGTIGSDTLINLEADIYVSENIVTLETLADTERDGFAESSTFVDEYYIQVINTFADNGTLSDSAIVTDIS